MKEGFHKISSMIMALMVLASTVSWTVEKHYCMGHLVDVALFSKADSCKMNMPLNDEIPVEKSCCDDEIIVADGQDDLKLSFEDITFKQQSFLVAFTFTYIDLFRGLEQNAIPLEHYPPPILVRDILVLDQVFLI